MKSELCKFNYAILEDSKHQNIRYNERQDSRGYNTYRIQYNAFRRTIRIS